MADNPTSLATIAADYAEVLSNNLVLAPDPELPFAKLAYSSAQLAEMAGSDDYDVAAAQAKAMVSTKSGDAANIAAAMANGGQGSIILSQGMSFPDFIFMVAEAKGPGENIKINRPKYLDDVVSESRWLNPLTTMFGNTQPLSMDQISVQIRESSGPGDINGNTVPVSIPLFVQQRARHDLLKIASEQMHRSRWRWVHYQIQQRLLATPNVTRPLGVASDTAFTGTDNEPFSFEMIPRIIEQMKRRNIPGLAGTSQYVYFCDPHVTQQLQNDAKYQNGSQYFPGLSALFPGYVGTVNNLHFCEVNTFPTLTTLGAGSNVTGYQGVCVAAGAIGWALGEDASILRDKNDDGGRFLKAGWRAVEGFATLNTDFIQRTVST